MAALESTVIPVEIYYIQSAVIVLALAIVVNCKVLFMIQTFCKTAFTLLFVFPPVIAAFFIALNTKCSMLCIDRKGISYVLLFLIYTVSVNIFNCMLLLSVTYRCIVV